jgi:hypothetical protein
MLANGTVLAINEGTPDYLHAVACSVNALGIITEATLKAVRTFYAEDLPHEWSSNHSSAINSTIMHFPHWSSHTPIKSWKWFGGTPGHRRRGGIMKRRTQRCSKPSSSCLVWYRSFQRTDNTLIYSFQTSEREMGIASDRVHNVVEQFMKYVSWNIDGLNPDQVQWFVLGRYSAPEAAWLSPAYQQETCWLTFYIRCIDPTKDRTTYCRRRRAPGYCERGEVISCSEPQLQQQFQRFGDRFEQLAYEVGDARPHWGKDHSAGSAHLARVYPKHADFVRLMKELDPKGLFLNSYLRRADDDMNRHRFYYER